VPYQWILRQPLLERPGRSVWRYVPIWKFEDMVRGRHVFFSRLRYLVDEEIDIYEGALANLNFENLEANR